MTMLSAIIVVGLGTYAMRALFLVTLSDRTFPPLALRLLEYVAPAVLGSLVISMLIDSEAQVALGAPELAGLAAAAIIAAKTRSHVLALFSAMALFWLLRWLA